VLAVSQWDHFVLENRAIIQSNLLIRAINLARVSAIKEGAVVSLCGSSDLKTCNGNWSNSYLLIIERSKNIIRVFENINGDTLTWKGFGSEDKLQLLPSGMTRFNNGTFYYCPKSKQKK